MMKNLKDPLSLESIWTVDNAEMYWNLCAGWGAHLLYSTEGAAHENGIIAERTLSNRKTARLADALDKIAIIVGIYIENYDEL